MAANEESMRSECREDEDESQQPATKADLLRLESAIVAMTNGQGTSGLSGLPNTTKSLDALKAAERSKILKALKNAQAFDYTSPENTAKQVFCLLKNDPQVIQQLYKYLFVKTLSQRELCVSVPQLLQLILNVNVSPFDATFGEANKLLLCHYGERLRLRFPAALTRRPAPQLTGTRPRRSTTRPSSCRTTPTPSQPTASPAAATASSRSSRRSCATRAPL